MPIHELTEGVVPRDDFELHYWLGGPVGAPLVVLTHGASMDHRLWEPQLPVLLSRFRTVLYDMRGHGASLNGGYDPGSFSVHDAVADLDALIATAGSDAVVLVGHSLGGTISQLFALEHPGRVRAFVGLGVACVTMRPTLPMRVFSAIAAPATRLMGARRLRADTVKRAGLTEETRAYASDAVAGVPDEAFEAVVSVGFGDYQDIPDYTFGKPLLLLQGDQDAYGNLLGSARAWAERDGGEFLVVPNARHNTGMDNPEFVNEQLLAFLERATRDS